MGRAGVKKTAGCLRRDPAPRLHSARKSRQRVKSLLKVLLVGLTFLNGVEENDMAS